MNLFFAFWAALAWFIGILCLVAPLDLTVGQSIGAGLIAGAPMSLVTGWRPR